MRTYDSQSLVDLPLLDGSSASLLAKSLVTVAGADRRRLPDNVAHALKKLETAEKELSAALGERLAPAESSERADLAAKNAWSALDSWLSGWMRLTQAPAESKTASELKGQLLSDGLGWLRKKSKETWSDANTRLIHLDQERLAPKFAALGGEPFLKALRTTTQQLGAALGVTGTPAPEAPSPAVGKKLDQTKKALRFYVVQLAALDEDDADQKALRDRLLKPLTEWEPKPVAKKTEGGGEGDKAAGGKDKPSDQSGSDAPKNAGSSSPNDAPAGANGGDGSTPPQA